MNSAIKPLVELQIDPISSVNQVYRHEDDDGVVAEFLVNLSCDPDQLMLANIFTLPEPSSDFNTVAYYMTTVMQIYNVYIKNPTIKAMVDVYNHHVRQYNAGKWDKRIIENTPELYKAFINGMGFMINTWIYQQSVEAHIAPYDNRNIY